MGARARVAHAYPGAEPRHALWIPHVGCIERRGRIRDRPQDCKETRLGKSTGRPCHGQRGDRMRRREFIALLGGAVAPWPLAAGAQQPTTPVIGLLSPRASGDVPQLIAAVRQGLKESGYVEGQNVTIEYRFAEHQNERLAALAADLVHRQVTVIVATAAPAAVAARAATTSIPIIFEMGDDPVRLGFVT